MVALKEPTSPKMQRSSCMKELSLVRQSRRVGIGFSITVQTNGSGLTQTINNDGEEFDGTESQSDNTSSDDDPDDDE